MLKNKKILIFTVAVFLILFFVILYTSIDDFEKHYIVYIQEKSIDLNDFYDENSIIFTEKQSNINEITCSYIQLDGLKKTKIENNVNKSIRNKLQDLTQNVKDLSKNIYVEVSGNFGNTLSIIYYIIIDEKQVVLNTLNYNLVNGEELELYDVFTSDTVVEEIMLEELKNQLGETTISDCEQGNEIEKSDMCLQNSDSINNYLQELKSSNYKFYFNQFGIYVLFNDFTLEIPYYKHAKNFSLHYKYLTNVSIYKNDMIGEKDILIASYRNNGIYSTLDYVSKNIYMDSVIVSSEKNISNVMLNGIKELMNEHTSNLINLYTDKFVFINESGFLSRLIVNNNIEGNVSNKYNIYTLSVDSKLYDLDESYFKEELKTEVYNKHRLNKINNNFISISSYKHKKEDTVEWILLTNGRVLENIDDLFVDGYDYKDAIKRIIMNKYNISDLEVVDLLEDSTYTYQLINSNIDNAYCIVVTTSDNEQFFISFDEFDNTKMYVY